MQRRMKQSKAKRNRRGTEEDEDEDVEEDCIPKKEAVEDLLLPPPDLREGERVGRGSPPKAELDLDRGEDVEEGRRADMIRANKTEERRER